MLKHITELSVLCLLLASLSLSGCRTFSAGVGKSFASTHAGAEYDATCEKRCSDLAGEDYDNCHMLCMLAERRRAEANRKESHEKETSEPEKK